MPGSTPAAPVRGPRRWVLHRGCARAIPVTGGVAAPRSRSAAAGARVERCCRTMRQARRWDTPNRCRNRSTARRRRSGVRSFLGQLIEHRLVQLLLGQQLLQPGVLGLQLTQPLGAVSLHPAVLATPPMPGRLTDLQIPRHLGCAYPYITVSTTAVNIWSIVDPRARRLCDVAERLGPIRDARRSPRGWGCIAGVAHPDLDFDRTARPQAARRQRIREIAVVLGRRLSGDHVRELRSSCQPIREIEV
jgi:hypothetical protein